MLTIYTYAGCSTCREAVKWLHGRGLAFSERAIRGTPPVAGGTRTHARGL